MNQYMMLIDSMKNIIKMITFYNVQFVYQQIQFSLKRLLKYVLMMLNIIMIIHMVKKINIIIILNNIYMMINKSLN